MLRAPSAASGAETYRQLREMALSPATARLLAPGPDHPDVAGVIIDLPQGGSDYVTLVAMSDGTTSLYNSLGGGQIGNGQYQAVADATHQLLTIVQRELAHFYETTDTSHTAAGAVRIFAPSPTGLRSTDVSDDAFWGRAEDRLSPVIAAIQAVITEIRRAALKT